MELGQVSQRFKALQSRGADGRLRQVQRVQLRKLAEDADAAICDLGAGQTELTHFSKERQLLKPDIGNRIVRKVDVTQVRHALGNVTQSRPAHAAIVQLEGLDGTESL